MGFYQELSALTSLAHPECFFAAHDATTQDAVLLLEDVAGRGHQIDQIAGYMSDLIDVRVEAFGDSFVEMVPSIFAKLCEGPLTLAHADWRLDNLFFTGDDAQPVIAVDWQLIDRSVGPRDVAYLVTQSLELSSTAQYREALDIYLDELGAAGVRADPEWAWEMYRHAVRFGFVYPVIAGGSLTVADERHQELCRALMRRCVTAMDALEVYDLPV